jgi:hypothetical protein
MESMKPKGCGRGAPTVAYKATQSRWAVKRWRSKYKPKDNITLSGGKATC